MESGGAHVDDCAGHLRCSDGAIAGGQVINPIARRMESRCSV